MKIALIGYGKMGRAIEKIALERGHEIVARIDVDNHDDMDTDAFRSADVAIEFTTPATAFSNCVEAFCQGVKVVSGTTGWTELMPLIKELCDNHGETFFWTSNFSIGVNLFFALNAYLAKLMENFPQYVPSMEEIHHIHKLDHPSGTAVSLANDIIANSPRLSAWTEQMPAPQGELPIAHRREGEVPGTHIVSWDSPVDNITITHTAKSRQGFALGAVVAAEWVATQTGFLTMPSLMERIVGNAKLIDILK
ncbi:MAG: 4-hydroxy-tetrahydrodipicolinate reductase [Firmicutes bacterium]|nr:4-hydroxy-tetrahydrodipicolinate reductase [Bacillota bacterium]MCM1401587.1 4-hydroxy-tetrahydrodipicolinate reductase [Bacteroides sp.]MCM1477471.1 4-hydroxy-tetrahydrodipicolinate reductase [Bacteroides sp.]